MWPNLFEWGHMWHACGRVSFRHQMGETVDVKRFYRSHMNQNSSIGPRITMDTVNQCMMASYREECGFGPTQPNQTSVVRLWTFNGEIGDYHRLDDNPWLWYSMLSVIIWNVPLVTRLRDECQRGNGNPPPTYTLRRMIPFPKDSVMSLVGDYGTLLMMYVWYTRVNIDWVIPVNISSPYKRLLSIPSCRFSK